MAETCSQDKHVKHQDFNLIVPTTRLSLPQEEKNLLINAESQTPFKNKNACWIYSSLLDSISY